MSLNFSATIEQLLGLGIYGGINKIEAGSYYGATVYTLGLAKQLGPGMFGFSVMDVTGMPTDYQVVYSFSKAF